MTEIFLDIPNVIVYTYSDDSLVCESTIKEHNRCLRQVIQRAVEQGVKFNLVKCVFATTKVKYLGNVFSRSHCRSRKGQGCKRGELLLNVLEN